MERPPSTTNTRLTKNIACCFRVVTSSACARPCSPRRATAWRKLVITSLCPTLPANTGMGLTGRLQNNLVNPRGSPSAAQTLQSDTQNERSRHRDTTPSAHAKAGCEATTRKRHARDALRLRNQLAPRCQRKALAQALLTCTHGAPNLHEALKPHAC